MSGRFLPGPQRRASATTYHSLGHVAGQEEHLKSDDDIEAILRLAVRSEGATVEDLRARLVSTAAELGISEQALRAAEERYRLERQAELTAVQDAHDRRLYKKMRWGAFVSHLASYVVVNSFLVWIDLRDGDIGWVYWVLFGWGIGVALDLVSHLTWTQEQEREFLKWQKRRHKGRSA
jgi:hypothetical protein